MWMYISIIMETHIGERGADCIDDDVRYHAWYAMVSALRRHLIAYFVDLCEIDVGPRGARGMGPMCMGHMYDLVERYGGGGDGCSSCDVVWGIDAAIRDADSRPMAGPHDNACPICASVDCSECDFKGLEPSDHCLRTLRCGHRVHYDCVMMKSEHANEMCEDSIGRLTDDVMLIAMCPVCGDDAEFSSGWRRLGGRDRLEIALSYIVDNRFDVVVRFCGYGIPPNVA